MLLGVLGLEQAVQMWALVQAQQEAGPGLAQGWEGAAQGWPRRPGRPAEQAQALRSWQQAAQGQASAQASAALRLMLLVAAQEPGRGQGVRPQAQEGLPRRHSTPPEQRQGQVALCLHRSPAKKPRWTADCWLGSQWKGRQGAWADAAGGQRSLRPGPWGAGRQRLRAWLAPPGLPSTAPRLRCAHLYCNKLTISVSIMWIQACSCFFKLSSSKRSLTVLTLSLDLLPVGGAHRLGGLVHRLQQALRGLQPGIQLDKIGGEIW